MDDCKLSLKIITFEKQKSLTANSFNPFWSVHFMLTIYKLNSKKQYQRLLLAVQDAYPEEWWVIPPGTTSCYQLGQCQVKNILLQLHNNPHLLDEISRSFQIFDPYIICDYYYASQIVDSPFKNKLEVAINMHKNMEDQGVGGKDANEYSFPEMVELGFMRRTII